MIIRVKIPIALILERERVRERTNHEMDFADGFAVAGGAVTVAVDAAEGFLADDHGAVLDVVVED